MVTTQLAPPYPIFTDRDGSPLDAGYLYFGEINQNPETNPIQIYYDTAFTIPAAQPLRTSNGYVMRNGSPALVYAGSQFSVTVRNKKSELVIYSPVGYGVDPASISGSVIYDDFTGDGVTAVFTLTASPSTKNATNIYIDGVYQSKNNYNTSGSTLTFSTAPPLLSAIEVVSQESSIIGGASSQQITYNQGGSGAVTRTVQGRLQDYVSVKDFGAVGDGVTDDTAAIQNAYNYTSNQGGGKIVWPYASYYVAGTIYFAGNTETDLMRSNVYANGQTLFETGYLSSGAIISNVGTPVGDFSTAVFKSSIGNGTLHNPGLAFRLNKSLSDTLYHDIEVQNYTGTNDTQLVNATECFFSNFKRFKYFGFSDGYVTGTANTSIGSPTVTIANVTAAKLSSGWIIRNHFTTDILPTEITVVSVGAADSGGAGLTNVVISQNATITVAAGGVNSGFVASKPNYVPMWKFDNANSNIVMEKVSGVARFVAFDLTDFNSSTIISPDIESGVAVGFRMKNCVGVSITGMYSEAIYHTLFDVSQGGCYLDIGPGNYFQNAGSITAGAAGTVSGSMIMAETMSAYTPYGFSPAGTPIINLSSPNAGMNIIGGPVDIKLQNPTSKSRYLGQYGLSLGNTASSDPTTLDWYQEGTWAPVLEGGTTAGVGTYSIQYGTYTRIGNRVYYTFRVVWSAHTGTGRLLLANFPGITTVLVSRPFPVNVVGAAGSQFYFLSGGTSFTKPDLVSVNATGVSSLVNVFAAGEIVGCGHYDV